MKQLLTWIAAAALALPAMASPQDFRAIIGDAANIQRDAEKLSRDLKQKSLDQTQVKQDITSLNADVTKLKQDVTELDGKLGEMSAAQKKEWELVKTKVQLLSIFHERKAGMLDVDIDKNRSMIRALSQGIASRARMLQATIVRLDK